MTLRALRRSITANKVVQKEFKSSDDPSSTADDLYFVNLVGMYILVLRRETRTENYRRIDVQT